MTIIKIFLTTLCTRPPFIKDLNLPSCVNCVHLLDYQRRDSYDYDKKAYRSKTVRLWVFWRNKYDFASTCRIDKPRCGEKGAYYNPIVKKSLNFGNKMDE